MFDALRTAPRLLLEAPLAPLQGDRFQPTGFADLGPATYERPDGTKMLLVESAQSVANRLEAACLDGPEGPHLAPELEGLPYVVAQLTGDAEHVTSSLVEPHRLNSPFIISDEEFQSAFLDHAGYQEGQPIDWGKVGAALLRFDPNSLLHGFFMANIQDGRLRVPRAISGFIEARDVREVASGGVKNNTFDPSGRIRVKGIEKDVYSNVPYARLEFVADEITAYFNLDLSLLRGYDLGDDACDLLTALALYKVQAFLDEGLRLRTACDLRVTDALRVTAPTGYEVPTRAELLSTVQTKIKACAEEGLFADPAVTELTVPTKKTRKKKS